MRDYDCFGAFGSFAHFKLWVGLCVLLLPHAINVIIYLPCTEFTVIRLHHHHHYYCFEVMNNLQHLSGSLQSALKNETNLYDTQTFLACQRKRTKQSAFKHPSARMHFKCWTNKQINKQNEGKRQEHISSNRHELRVWCARACRRTCSFCGIHFVCSFHLFSIQISLPLSLSWDICALISFSWFCCLSFNNVYDTLPISIIHFVDEL